MPATRSSSRVTGPKSCQQRVQRNLPDDDSTSEASYSDANEVLYPPRENLQQQQQQQPQRNIGATEVSVYVTQFDILLNAAKIDQVYYFLPHYLFF